MTNSEKEILIESTLPGRQLNDFRFPLSSKDENISAAVDFLPKKGDVLLASYPYAVSDWVIHCIWKLVNLGHEVSDCKNYESSLNCIENTGTKRLIGASPRLVRCNLPYWLKKRNDFAKYIYVIRNPRDTLIVYYLKSVIDNQVQIPFDDFFRDFFGGHLPYGGYFDHIHSWYEPRDPNVLVLNYENMHVNPRQSVQEMAKFLGPRYFDECLEDSVMDYILQYSDLDYRKFTVKGDYTLMNCFQQLLDKHCLAYQSMYDQFRQGLMPIEYVGSCIGFWRKFSYITEDKWDYMNWWIEEKFSGDLFRNYEATNLLDMIHM